MDCECSLKKALLCLGNDLEYLDCSLPTIGELPTSEKILQLHQDLSRLDHLTFAIENGEIPACAVTDGQAADALIMLKTLIYEWEKTLTKLNISQNPWVSDVRRNIFDKQRNDIIQLLEDLRTCS